MIISLSGRMGSGKDLAYKFIAQWLYKNTDNSGTVENKKFAGKLKIVASLLTGVPAGQFEDQEFKKLKMSHEWGDMTYREFLQKLGTEAIRDNIHQQAWVNALFADYRPELSWVITDTRFPNEAQAVKDRGGILIRLRRGEDNSEDQHPSETALDNYDGFDFVVNNNSTIEDFRGMISAIMATISKDDSWKQETPITLT